MRCKQMFFALVAMLSCFVLSANAQNVAKIGGTEYATLTAAIKAAAAGQTITFIGDVTENVTVDKNLTIDGADFNYTGTLTAGTGLTVTVQNVNFVNAGFTKVKGTTGKYTIKDCTFDGANRTYGYAVTTKGANTLTIENCTVKDYSYGFLYNSHSLTNHSVKNVTVENCNYGVRMVSTATTNLVNFVTSNVKNPVQIETSAARTVNMTDCSITEVPEGGASLSCWNGTKTLTFNFKGTNKFDAELPTDANFIYKDANGNQTENNNNDNVVIVKPAVAMVGEQGYETLSAAVAAAPAGGTVTLLADATETATVVLTKNLTIDGAGHTFTGAIELNKSKGTYTIKNVKFNGGDNKYYAVKSTSGCTKLTVENCTATAYTYGFLHLNKSVTDVFVNGATVEDVNYGVHSVYGTNVTLNNFVAKNVKNGVMVQNYGTRNVVLNNCSFTGCETPLYVWKRDGYENKITFNFKGVNEMGKADFCTSDYAVINADAMAGTKVCEKLADAVEAAEAGETVALLRNVQLDALLTIDNSITLDLGKYNITRDARTALYVEGDDVEVTINGEGTVSGKQALYVGGGLVKVYGGNFHGLTEAVYVQNSGKAEIYGGKFSSDNVTYVLNEYDKTRETSDITVYGGTFTGFNPADNAAEGDGTNFVADSYVSQDNGDGTYTVKYDPAYGKVAKIGDTYYETFAEAVAAAQNGETVVVIDNIALDATVVVDNKTMTLDLNGMTITGTDNNTSGNFYLINNNKGNLTIVDGSEAQSGKITLVATTERNWSASSVVVANNLGTVTVNGGAIEHLGGTSMAYGIDNLTNGANTVATLNIKGGSVASTYFAVRQFANNGTNNLNITGGNVGYAWMQSPNANVNVANISVTDGEVAGLCFTGKNADVTLDAKVECVGKVYGTMPAGVALITVDGYYTFAPAVAAVGDALYASIQEAVTAAETGATVTMVDDAEMTTADLATQNDGYAVLVNVNGKKVTIDLNGKNITVDAADADLASAKGGMLLGVFSADLGGHLTLTDNSDAKNGAVTVNVNDAKVYSVFVSESKESDKSNSGKITVNGGNYTTVGKLANAMFFADADEVITVNGGNFYCDGATTGTPYPWIINTLGNDILQVVVKGGTFNVELNKQHRYKEIEIPYGYVVVNNGDGTWTVKGAVAVLNGVGYLTFDEAYADAKNGDVIELLQTVVITNSKPWINYSKKQITVNAEFGDVAFRIQDGAYVWFGGMTVNSNDYCFIVGAKDGSSGATVEFYGGTYNGATSVVSVTKGDVKIMGGTFKVEPYEGNYNYTINCVDANYENKTAKVAISGGKFYKFNPANNAAEGADTNFLVARYAASEDAEGWWTVAEAVAQVGNAYFATLAEAVEAVENEGTVTVVNHAAGAGVVINKDVTIDFNGKTYTVNKGVGSKGTETLGLQILKGNTVTLENGTLTSEGENILMLVQNYADLTVRDMHLDGSNLYGTGRYVLSNNSGNVVVKGATDITAKAGDFAFDAYKYADYEAPTVTVKTTGKIAGKIEETGGNLVIMGGTYDMNVNEWCADYCTSKPNADGTYNVVAGVTLVDGKFTEYTLSENMEVEYIRYQRSLGTAWNTMYLPFEIPMSMLVEKYEIAYINDIRQSDTNADGEIDKLVVEHVLIKDANATLLANYPYLIRPKTAEAAGLDLVFDEGAMLYAAEEISLDCSSIGTYYKFTGNAHKMNAEELKDKYAMSKSGEWKHSFSSMSPFRVYFSIETRPGSHIKISKNLTIVSREYGEEGTTGVDSIDSELGEGMIFDLQGRRVLETEKGGIYIKGGKKFIAQ